MKEGTFVASPDVAVPIPVRPSSSSFPRAQDALPQSRSGSHGKLFPSHVETRLRRTTTGMGWRWRRWRQRRWRRWRALRTLPDLIVFCLPPSAEDGVESSQKTFSLFKKKSCIFGGLWQACGQGLIKGIGPSFRVNTPWPGPDKYHLFRIHFFIRHL